MRYISLKIVFKCSQQEATVLILPVALRGRRRRGCARGGCGHSPGSAGGELPATINTASPERRVIAGEVPSTPFLVLPEPSPLPGHRTAALSTMPSREGGQQRSGQLQPASLTSGKGVRAAPGDKPVRFPGLSQCTAACRRGPHTPWGQEGMGDRRAKMVQVNPQSQEEFE